MIGALKAIWTTINSPNNDAVVIGLALGWLALLSSQVTTFLNFRARLQDKDKTIEDLIAQRNKWEDLVLEQKGMKRLSTEKNTSAKSKNRKGGNR